MSWIVVLQAVILMVCAALLIGGLIDYFKNGGDK